MHAQMGEGIVLRAPKQYTQKVIIFDRYLGKISAIVQRGAHPLVHGHYLTYRLEPWKNMYKLCDMQAVKVPASWVAGDILFLHHVLEVALFFLPHGSCAAHLFALCGILYEAWGVEAIDQRLAKKLFLGKFFALLGVYPDEAVRQDAYLFHLFSGAGAQVPELHENSDGLHKKLEQWLLHCIQTHPHANTFTTIQFLYAQN